MKSSLTSMTPIFRNLLAFVLIAVGGTGQAASDLEFGSAPAPLSPEVAFVPSVSAERNELTVTYAIEDGYYLYRDKLAFTIEDTEVQLGSPDFPVAEVIDDEYFGEMHTYRNTARITLPLTVQDSQSSLDLTLRFQGCADIGICYPPISKTVSVELPETLAKTGNSLRDLLGTGSLQNSNEPDLLSPDEAFVPIIANSDPANIALQWQIEPGYYLYRNKLSFSLENADGSSISETRLDPGTMQNDAYFGDVPVYRNSATADLAMSKPIASSNAALKINYQGCADIGVCFPPQSLTLPVGFSDAANDNGGLDVLATLKSVAGSGPSSGIPVQSAAQSISSVAPASTSSTASVSSVSSVASASKVSTSQPVSISEQDRLTAQLVSGSLWLNAASFFVLGLLLAFTPCVLPMVPILSSLIVGQGEGMSTARAFRLSLIYVLAMAFTYTIVGVLVGLSGYNIQAWFQNPWVLSTFAGLFVLLSLSMFGFYELQLPTGLQQRLTNVSNRQQGGSWHGVASMGFLSALIVGPCVTAPLVGALVYIADTGDAVVGGVALFSLSMGMGAPLLLIGASAGELLPRAGAWMNATKQIFGIMLLGMAIYMLSRFLPANIIMGMSAVLAVISGIYLGATDNLDRDSSGWSRMSKGVGLVVSLYGVALMIGAMSGNASFITPLRGIAAGNGSVATEASRHLDFQRVKSVQDLQSVVAKASAAGQPVMLDFYADWCVSCKEMENFTFTDTRVKQQLSNAILIQADVTDNDKIDQELLKHFGLFGPPAIIFYDRDGNELRPARVVGYMPADRFSGHVQGFLNRPDV